MQVDTVKQPIDNTFELAFNWCEVKSCVESGSVKHRVMDIFKPEKKGPWKPAKKFLTGKQGQAAWNRLLTAAVQRYHSECDARKRKAFGVDATAFHLPIVESKKATKAESEVKKKGGQEEKAKRRRFRMKKGEVQEVEVG